MRIKQIIKLVLNDIANAYSYIFVFYVINLILSFFFESWKLFFYWPAFHIIVIIFGILSFYSEKGKEIKLKVYQTINSSSYKASKVENYKVNKIESGKRKMKIKDAHIVYELKKLSVKIISDLAKRKMTFNSFKIYNKIFLGIIYKATKTVKAIAILFFLIAKQVLEILIYFAILKIKKLKKIEYLKIGIIIIVLGYAINNKIDIINFSILAYALISILFILDSRIAAAIALLLLISVPFLLINKNEVLAEQMAIYVYYFLVITVLTQIREYRKEELESKKL